MRSISSAFDAHLSGGVTTLCTCWRLKRQDGIVLGFTDHDRDLVFETNTFLAGAGLNGASSETSSGMSVGGTDVAGVLSASTISEFDLAAGLYDNARVEVWRVNWVDTDQRVLLDVFSLGEVRRSAQSFSAELRSMSHLLDQDRGRRYQAVCAAELGDISCGVDIESAAFSVGLLVSGGDGRHLITAAVAGIVENLFDGGRLAVLSGPMAGVSRAVDQVRISTSEITIRLWTRLPGLLAIGEQIRLSAGCDKSFATCRAKFSNQLNFRGFPHIPGNDALMSHVSGSGAKMDGGSLFR